MRRVLKNHVLAVRISDGDWERLRVIAKAEGCKSPSRYVRKILSIGTHTLFDKQARPTPRREPSRSRRRPTRSKKKT